MIIVGRAYVIAQKERVSSLGHLKNFYISIMIRTLEMIIFVSGKPLIG